MRTTTAVHGDIYAALTAAGVATLYGPATDLPAGADGLVGQAAILWPSPGLYAYTRACGTSSGRADRVTVICVGATVRDALAVASREREGIERHREAWLAERKREEERREEAAADDRSPGSPRS